MPTSRRQREVVALMNDHHSHLFTTHVTRPGILTTGCCCDAPTTELLKALPAPRPPLHHVHVRDSDASQLVGSPRPPAPLGGLGSTNAQDCALESGSVTELLRLPRTTPCGLRALQKVRVPLASACIREMEQQPKECQTAAEASPLAQAAAARQRRVPEHQRA